VVKRERSILTPPVAVVRSPSPQPEPVECRVQAVELGNLVVTVISRDWGSVAAARGCRLCPSGDCHLRQSGSCTVVFVQEGLAVLDAESARLLPTPAVGRRRAP
jgi:hypothetical protein